MTTLLSKAIKEIENLPPELQDEIARQILEDIECELKWQATLVQPQSKLEKLAEKALEESKAGKTKKMGFDEL
jgi:aspartate/tyrosine/aromatic aminotransferase